NPDFQTKSGFFVFRRNAKSGRILRLPVFQKVEQKQWSINLLLMSLLLDMFPVSMATFASRK
ncbi:hypothetical protein, partial [Phocaeicola sartorii]|uniref:hypothetical protein n=1 Tax=Phocaeicola sartorii TaxID=671267 RepID=UPI002596A45A